MKTDEASGGFPAVVVRHDTELGTWDRLELPPSAPLRGLVRGYHDYAQRRLAPAMHRAMPMPGVPIIITLGPHHIIRSRSGAATRHTSFVAGPHDRHVFVEADGFVGLQADLTPMGAYRLLGRALRELANEVVPLDAVLGADAERLVDDLAGEPTPQRRLARLDAALRRRLADAARPTPQVAWAFERLWRSGGTTPVGALAGELGWSRRHLSARFAEEFGLTPKRTARLIRFHRAVALLERPDGPGLAEIAQLAGYYDQAHLANEVLAHCGISPTQVRARVLPDGGRVGGTRDG